ncbi:uncharacterized protein LOC141500438 isoform X2 [Macrotis lagotis]|uniref:uncharacterized protein LOC141500438 isoform X2 n=1 Tax=Macrotis lagotis TaxID=92651 RepID=UPI003D691C1A
MSSSSTGLPVPQLDSSRFWTDHERRFPDGGNQQTPNLVIAPVAQKSPPLPLNSYPFSRENKLHAGCPEPRGSEKNDSEEGFNSSSENLAASFHEEKIPLLKTTTELRKLNKELMKLNQEWEHIYHTATMQMHQKMSSLQMQVVSLKQRAECLTIKLDHEQNKKEYYEQALLQELRKNQHLQEYVKYLENKMYQNTEKRTLLNFLEGYGTPPVLLTRKNLKDSAQLRYKLGSAKGPMPVGCQHQLDTPIVDKEMTDLIDQLESLNLQIKNLEDDFRKEHFDKQVFPRHLNKSQSISPIPEAFGCHTKEKLSAFSITTLNRPRPGGCSK